FAVVVAVLWGWMALTGPAGGGGWRAIPVGATAGLLAAGCHAASFLLAGGVINGFGHASSTQRPNGGYARNMPVIAWFTVGEGWHRNHHAAENSPRIGHRHQLHLGWLAIRGLCALRLAHLTPPRAPGRQTGPET